MPKNSIFATPNIIFKLKVMFSDDFNRENLAPNSPIIEDIFFLNIRRMLSFLCYVIFVFCVRIYRVVFVVVISNGKVPLYYLRFNIISIIFYKILKIVWSYIIIGINECYPFCSNL